MKLNWGQWIFISFIVFGAIMTTMVIISMKSDVNLVAENYYEKEIKHQDQIDRVRNYNELGEKPELSFSREQAICILKFPESEQLKEVNGKIHFFRPSDSKKDRIFELSFESGNALQMDVSDMIKGLWTIQVSWSDGSKEYYFEESMYL